LAGVSPEIRIPVEVAYLGDDARKHPWGCEAGKERDGKGGVVIQVTTVAGT
jgi:hypothetical protein